LDTVSVCAGDISRLADTTVARAFFVGIDSVAVTRLRALGSDTCSGDVRVVSGFANTTSRRTLLVGVSGFAVGIRTALGWCADAVCVKVVPGFTHAATAGARFVRIAACLAVDVSGAFGLLANISHVHIETCLAETLSA